MSTWTELLAVPLPRRRLVAAVEEWMYDLRMDRLPWDSWHDEDAWCLALSLWVLRYAPAAVREHDAPAELHDDVRLLALPYDDRWDR
ncbi:hypothetical protein ABTX15_22375 [Micromonospora sp. NPDC094482]|uniref:hypothetical protein n=1 Tax=unclassified Micromonospora TaxID=2617518 RepID=UPI00332BD826